MRKGKTMDTFDRHQLELLLASEGGPHISVFLPAPRKQSEVRDDAIRVSNFVGQAHATLTDHWMRPSEADDFLKPLGDLVHDREFLSDRRHGSAIYLCGDLFLVYAVSQAVPEQMFISRRFRIRPMLSVLDHLAKFHLLTLSKKEVKLYRGTQQSISQVEQVRLPKGFEESMVELSISAERGAQAHSAAKEMTGKQAAVFHGQGGRPDAEKAEIREYLRQVDTAVSRFLQDSSGHLILAGVEYLTSIYRLICSCSTLADETISGNVDHLSPKELLQQAMPIVTAEMRRERQADEAAVGHRRRHGAATDAEQVLCAAFEGRIDALFFDTDATLEGSFYPDTRTLQELHRVPSGQPGDPGCDLIELAAIQTLRHGGRVHAVNAAEMPIDGRIAASLRY
jgi:hypothetical protein